VLGAIIANELAEGPGPCWLGNVTDGLREQAGPDGAVVEMVAILGRDLEQGGAADDRQQA
jgi:hypothetical protein